MRIQRDGKLFRLDVNETELNALHSGLAETLEALEDWEFQTRTGLHRAEMRAILLELREARRELTKDDQPGD